MIKNRYVSRLARKQRSQNLRFAILMSLLTAGVLALLVFAGLPLFIKLAAWWADVAQTELTSEDTTAPIPPRLRLAATVTNHNIIDISGFAESGTSIGIYINEQLIKEVSSESNGQFFASELQLKNGPNTIFALSTDPAGNQSQPSTTETVTLDTQLPELKIEQPQVGNQFKGEKQRRLEVIGNTEPGVRLWINERLVQVDDKGRFIHSITLLDGEQTIEVKAIDEAGNETIELVTVTYAP